MGSSLQSLTGGGCAGCRVPGTPLCARCSSDLGAADPVHLPCLERVSVCWRHEGVARGLVLGLKLGRRRDLAAPLIEGLVRSLMRSGTEGEVVTWPPCSRADRRRRGFDHAEVLARGVAERLGLPARPLLRRIARTADQAGLSGEERRSNLDGAFLARPAPPCVLLVDDVVTTGATLGACAGALRRAAAARVEAAVACSAFS